MKRIWLVFTLIFLLCICGREWLTQHALQSSILSALPTSVSTSPGLLPASQLSHPSATPSLNFPSKIVESNSSTRKASELTAHEVFENLTAQNFLASIQKNHDLSPYYRQFFSTPYAAATSSKQLTFRIGVLKAIANLPNSQVDFETMEKIRAFLQEVLLTPNEQWMVQRLALRNLNHFGWQKESNPEQILARLDPRVLHTAQFSDQEIFDQVMGNNR